MMSYQSPISVFWDDMQIKFENDVYEAVQKCNIDVDRDELIKALRYDRQQYEKGKADAVRHGWWIFEEYPDGYYHWECSICKAWFSDSARFGYNYCPNCGAKMDADKG